MIKANLKSSLLYLKVLLRWTILSIIIGIIGGGLGSVFHIFIDKVTEFRVENTSIIFFLPAGGVLIAFLYKLFSSKGKIDTNRVIESIRKDKNIPFVMIPLIFISTIITHLLGGSAGREGAALQLGGSVGYNVGRLFKFDNIRMRIVVMTGMASVFSALFGTPITAAIFSVEVVTVGMLRYGGLLPCVISSITAYFISRLFGLTGVHFTNVLIESFTAISFLKVAILSVLCALVSILFCSSIKKCEHIMDKLIKDSYLRGFVGGFIIIALTLLLNTYDYNGAGMDVIAGAINGETKTFAFLLKILFTAITISAGFKGGEIVPAFFIGSTFGCAVAPILGIDSGFAAAIGFVAIFCGVVNCPLASIILSIEVFGTEGLLFFALACGITYLMSGSFSLYDSQRFAYSKIDDEEILEN